MAKRRNTWDGGSKKPYVRIPVSESNDSIHSPIEEKGHDPVPVRLMLYDLSPPQFGHYSLRMVTDRHKDEVISALVESQNYKPIGFVNEPDGDASEPMHYVWSVQMKKKVAVEVRLLSDINLNANQCEIKFLSKRDVKRETIESKPVYSRLPTDCAKVDFTIFANCDTSKSARFRVVVRSDMETKCMDYNCLFMREPPECRVDRVVHPVTGRH